MKQKYRNIAEHLVRTRGVDILKYDASFLDRSFMKRMTETHCDSQQSYCELLEQNESEGKILLNSLTVSFSEFFRNPLTFSVLEQIILPSIVAKNRNNRQKEIRIWAAACAAGQEAYSLAILFEELQNVNQDKNFFRIFATDQDELQLREARKGQYLAENLNNVNLRRLNQWFTIADDLFSVKPALKKNIDFSVFDLFNVQLLCPQESIFGEFDLVVCANLLFYYQPEYQKIILEKANKCLVHGGYLITGETERGILIRHNYHEVFPQSAIFQGK